MPDDKKRSFAGEDHLTQAMAYHQGFLEGDEKVAFEAHLATCEECQESLALARKHFPEIDAALAARARERTPRVNPRPRVRTWAVRAAVAAVAAAAVVGLGFLAKPLLLVKRDRDAVSSPGH